MPIVRSPHPPRDVSAILSTWPPHPQALPLSACSPLSCDWQVRTSNPSPEPLQDSIQHVTPSKSWNPGDVAHLDGESGAGEGAVFSVQESEDERKEAE